MNALIGKVQFNGGGSAAGTFNLTGGTLVIPNSTFTLNAGSTFTGAGAIDVTGGSLAVAANVSIPTLALDGGAINGSATLTVAGSLAWNSGIMSGAGVTNIANGATLAMATANTKQLDTRTFNNAGAATSTGTGLFYLQNGAVFNNTGAFDVQNDQTFTHSSGINGAFNNTGTFTKSAGSGTTAFDALFNNNGTLNAQSGKIQLNAGGSASGIFNVTTGTVTIASATLPLNTGASFTGSGSVHLNGGTLLIAGNASVTNLSFDSGTLHITSAATFAITGAYSQVSGAILSIDLGGTTAGATFGRLAINGVATLAGTLSLNYVNGFIPAVGNTFALLTYASNVGTFQTINGLNAPSGHVLSPAYNSLSLVLTSS